MLAQVRQTRSQGLSSKNERPWKQNCRLDWLRGSLVNFKSFWLLFISYFFLAIRRKLQLIDSKGNLAMEIAWRPQQYTLQWRDECERVLPVSSSKFLRIFAPPLSSFLAWYRGTATLTKWRHINTQSKEHLEEIRWEIENRLSVFSGENFVPE